MDKRSSHRTWNIKTTTGRIGETLEDTGKENYFYNRNPIAQELRIRIEKWDCKHMVFNSHHDNSHQKKFKWLIYTGRNVSYEASAN